MPNDPTLRDQVQNLLKEKLLIQVDSPDFDLVEAEMIDSLVFTQLLMELVENFGFTAAMEEIDIDDFRSVNSISRLLAENMQTGEAA